MEKEQLHRSETLRRVQQFLTTNAGVVPPASDTDARRNLDSAIVAWDAAAADQATAMRELRGVANRKSEVESTLIRKFMAPMSIFARASLAGVPEYAKLTPSLDQLSGVRLIAAAKGMEAAAEPYDAELGKAKFPVNFLGQFREAITELQQVMADARVHREAKIDATKRIDQATLDGRTAVASLDGVVRHHILGNAVLERNWRSAKRVQVTKPAVAAPTAPPAPTVAGSIAPSASSVVTREVKAAA